MVNVLGYIRVSTIGQAKDGYSLAEQREEIEKYCVGNEFNLVDTFCDSGISGAKTDEEETYVERDGLLDLLARLKDGDIQYIVVLSTSRLWRSDTVKMIVHRELKKCKVDIKVIDRSTYSIYSNNPSDVLINGVFEVLDIYERLEITLKLGRGRKKKAMDGGYSGGGAPFGYRAVRGAKVLEIDTRQAKAVQRVFELAVGGMRVTLQAIADIMNKEGYTNSRGVRSMLC